MAGLRTTGSDDGVRLQRENVVAPSEPVAPTLSPLPVGPAPPHCADRAASTRLKTGGTMSGFAARSDLRRGHRLRRGRPARPAGWRYGPPDRGRADGGDLERLRPAGAAGPVRRAAGRVGAVASRPSPPNPLPLFEGEGLLCAGGRLLLAGPSRSPDYPAFGYRRSAIGAACSDSQPLVGVEWVGAPI